MRNTLYYGDNLIAEVVEEVPRARKHTSTAQGSCGLNGAHLVALDADTAIIRTRQEPTHTYWVRPAIPSEARCSREIGTSSIGGAGGVMSGAGGVMATSDPLTALKVTAPSAKPRT